MTPLAQREIDREQFRSNIQRVKRLADSLRGSICPACRGRKRTHMSLCGICYHKLPDCLKRALYQLIGEGYEEAHDEAMAYLGKEPLP